jgi:hypothetical protein
MRDVEAGVPTVERVIGERAELAVQGGRLFDDLHGGPGLAVGLDVERGAGRLPDRELEDIAGGSLPRPGFVRFWPAKPAAPWRAMGCPWKAAPFFLTSAWRSPVALLWQRRLPSSRTRLTPLGTVSRVGLAASQKPSVSNSIASHGMTVSALSATGSSAVSLTMAPRNAANSIATMANQVFGIRPRCPGCR